MENHVITYKEVEEFNQNRVISKDLKLIFRDFERKLGQTLKIKNEQNIQIVENEKYRFLSSKRCKVACIKYFANNQNINKSLSYWDFAIIAVKDENEKSNLLKNLKKKNEY